MQKQKHIYSDCGLFKALITIGSDGITFRGNGHSLIGSLTDKGAHIYEKSNVKVTDLKISSFQKAYPFHFPTTTSYKAYKASEIETMQFFETQMRTQFRKYSQT